MADCPSVKYYEQLRTADGLTPAKPFKLMPDEVAYDGWTTAVGHVVDKTRLALRELAKTKPVEKRTAAETAQWESFSSELSALIERFNSLPSPWNILDWTTTASAEGISAMTLLGTELVCLQERIDLANVAMGGKPTGLGPEHKDSEKPGFLATAGIVVLSVAAVGTVVVLSRRMDKGN